MISVYGPLHSDSSRICRTFVAVYGVNGPAMPFCPGNITPETAFILHHCDLEIAMLAVSDIVKKKSTLHSPENNAFHLSWLSFISALSREKALLPWLMGAVSTCSR